MSSILEFTNRLVGWFAAPLEFDFMRRALLASVLVGALCAVVGAFVVLKGLAFIGDALAHASFAGVAISLVVGSNVYLGGAVAAVISALSIAFISQRARVRADTAIGVVFVAMLSLGVRALRLVLRHLRVGRDHRAHDRERLSRGAGRGAAGSWHRCAPARPAQGLSAAPRRAGARGPGPSSDRRRVQGVGRL